MSNNETPNPAPEPVTESHTRSVLKALSWRVVATTTTFLIAWLWTGKIHQALAIGGIEFFAKMPVYYLHERGWQLVPRGSIRKLLPFGKKN